MTPTTLTAYITETWTPKTLEQFFAKAVAANHFLDLSAYTGGGSDIFHVPDVFTTAFTVTTAPDPYDAVEITTNGPATGDVTLTVDTHKYIAMLIGDRDMVQIAKGTYDVGSIYARKAGGTLMEALEADLFALWSSVSTNTVGDTASVITDTEIRQSIEKLASLKVPLNETAWFFHPLRDSGCKILSDLGKTLLKWATLTKQAIAVQVQRLSERTPLMVMRQSELCV